MTRTDIHRPGSPDFDPQAYDLIDVFDLAPPPADGFTFGRESDSARLGRELDALAKDGVTPGSHEWGCGHCGQTNLRYVALLVHRDAREWIFAGQDCLASRFSGQTKASFQALKKNAELARAKQAKLTAFRAECDKRPALAWATYADNIAAALPQAEREALSWNTNVQHDIASKARTYGSISDRQADFLAKLVSEAEDRVAQAVARATAEAERVNNAPELAEGRRELTGVIKSIKQVEDYYSPYGGTITKCLVELTDGNRVYGTLPAAINAAERGDTITFTGTVSRSDDDAHFGFYSRPAKATIAQEATA